MSSDAEENIHSAEEIRLSLRCFCFFILYTRSAVFSFGSFFMHKKGRMCFVPSAPLALLAQRYTGHRALTGMLYHGVDQRTEYRKFVSYSDKFTVYDTTCSGTSVCVIV